MAFPPPLAIVRACEEFGFSADWFYRGAKGGIARRDVVDALRRAAAQMMEKATA